MDWEAFWEASSHQSYAGGHMGKDSRRNMETFVHAQFKPDTVFGAETVFPSGILQ